MIQVPIMLNIIYQFIQYIYLKQKYGTIFRHLRYLYANMLQVTIMQKDPIICNGMNSPYFSELRSMTRKLDQRVLFKENTISTPKIYIIVTMHISGYIIAKFLFIFREALSFVKNFLNMKKVPTFSCLELSL